MDIAGGFALARSVSRAFVSLGLDRVADALGSSLPVTPETVATPAMIDRLLREHGPAGRPALPPVKAVRLPGVDFESSNCRNFLVEVDFARDSDEAGAPVPRTLYVKLPCEETATRLFGNAVGFWPLECTFCERVAHRLPIRVPRVYASARRGARFVLLLENLGEIPGVRLFRNRDMVAGATVEQARRVLACFAELHAAFWGDDDARREALLPLSLHTFLAPQRRAMTRAMNAWAIAPAHRAAPDRFDERHAMLCRRAVDRWDRLLAVWYREPLTLIHGDSHLGNCFEIPDGDGVRVGLLDFQGAQWCAGVRDVQYFLINSLDPDLLAVHEGALIEHYVGELERRGVALPLDDARAQYRAFSFQTLMASVVPLGMGGMTESHDTIRTLLDRAVRAVDRLDFAGWLDTL